MSSIGYPKALAERMPDLPSEISSRPNNPRPELQFIRLRFMHAVGIERFCDGGRAVEVI